MNENSIDLPNFSELDPKFPKILEELRDFYEYYITHVKINLPKRHPRFHRAIIFPIEVEETIGAKIQELFDPNFVPSLIEIDAKDKFKNICSNILKIIHENAPTFFEKARKPLFFLNFHIGFPRMSDDEQLLTELVLDFLIWYDKRTLFQPIPFDEAYKQFEFALFMDYNFLTIRIPLLNFEFESNNLKFFFQESQIKYLIKLQKREINEIREYIWDYGAIDVITRAILEKWTSTLEIIAKVPKTKKNIDNEIVISSIEKILDFLHLINSGSFQTWNWHIFKPFYHYHVIDFIAKKVPRLKGESKYVLKTDEKLKVGEFFEKFMKIQFQDDPSLRRGIDRLRIGQERRIQEDSIIDYVIGLESLFGYKIKDEITKQIAYRIAFFLTDIFQERKEIFDDIIDIYSLRSSIVHGEKIGKKHKNRVEDLITKSMDYLRKSIQKFIENNLKVSNFDFKYFILKNGWVKLS